MVRGLTLKGNKKIPFEKVINLLDIPVKKPETPKHVLAWKTLLEEKKNLA